MKNIFKTLAVFVMALVITVSASAQGGSSAKDGRSYVAGRFLLMLDGEGASGVIAPIDNKGNATIENVKPGTHTVALLLPAIQKIREAAARAKANDAPPPSIQIESYSWGVSQMGSGGHGGGGGAGKVSVNDISVMKTTDKSTPLLFKSVVVLPTKAPFNKIVQHNGQEYYKIELENILVSSYQSSAGGSSSGDRPMESLSLNFTKIEFKYDLKEGKN